MKIAIPKGRLGNEVINRLNSVDEYKNIIDSNSRKLVFTNAHKDLIFNMVKNADVTTYVEEKVFDLGFTGLDIVMENKPDVYVLERLNIGICKLSIAAPKDFKEYAQDRPLRVATSYLEISKEYFAQKGYKIDLMELKGSVELAPVLGLSDVIVDIVETGHTLRENGLVVIEDMYNICCCLIANKISYKFKSAEIDEFIKKIKEAQ